MTRPFSATRAEPLNCRSLQYDRIRASIFSACVAANAREGAARATPANRQTARAYERTPDREAASERPSLERALLNMRFTPITHHTTVSPPVPPEWGGLSTRRTT